MKPGQHMIVANPNGSFDPYGEIWHEGDGLHAVITNLAHDNLGHDDFTSMADAIAWLRDQMGKLSATAPE